MTGVHGRDTGDNWGYEIEGPTFKVVTDDYDNAYDDDYDDDDELAVAVYKDGDMNRNRVLHEKNGSLIQLSVDPILNHKKQ